MAELGKTLDQLTAAMSSPKEAAKMLDKITDTLQSTAAATAKGKKRTKRTSLSLLPASLTLSTMRATTTNSSAKRRQREREEKMEIPSTYWSIMSYISYIFLVVTGYIREMIWGIGPIDSAFGREFGREGYPQLYSSFEGFYTRNIFRRFKPVVGNPICNVPGSKVTIRDR